MSEHCNVQSSTISLKLYCYHRSIS